MLKKNVFREEMQKLIIFYPSWGIKADDQLTMKTWYNMMLTLSATNESLTKSVIKHIKEIKFTPTIASLIECGLKNENKTHFTDLSKVEVHYVD